MRKGLVFLMVVGGLTAWIAIGASLEDPSVRAQSATPTSLQLGRAGRAEFVPGFAGSKPIFVLLIGSDARTNVCLPVERCRADSIHVVGINPKKRAASILGIPRDSYVDIPGFGEAKINEAMVQGGPLLLVKTVEELVGVDIRYYFLTSFDGFRNMVNAVGGLDVEVPYAIGADHNIAPFAPGVQELDGDRALDFARNRTGTPNGDFTRSKNQGLVVLAALQKFRQEMRSEPMTLFTWMASALANIQTDLSAGEAFYLALATLSIEPGNVVNRVTPGGLGFAGEASIVTLGSEADGLFSDIRTDGLLQNS